MNAHPLPAEIPDRHISNRPVEQVRPGDVTLYGVVLDTEDGYSEILLHCWGQHTVTAAYGDSITVLGRVTATTFNQLRANAPRRP